MVGTKTLTVGEHFDFVVLAVGLGAVPHVCKELIEHSVPWQDMVRTCKSVATQALQLWMNADTNELGWRRPNRNISGVFGPFDTRADMTQLVPLERLSPAPRALARFWSVLSVPP